MRDTRRPDSERAVPGWLARQVQALFAEARQRRRRQRLKITAAVLAASLWTVPDADHEPKGLRYLLLPVAGVAMADAFLRPFAEGPLPSSHMR